MSRDRALTLPEILVSAALLLVLTGVALSALTPVWRRQEKFQSADDKVRGFLVAREALHGHLARARVRALDVRQLTVIFPFKIQTNHGPLSKLAPGETLDYDTETEFDVWFDVPGGRLMWNEQVLWRLGPGSDMRLEAFGADNAFVRFNFEGREEPTRADSPKWRRSFVLFLPNQER